MSCVSPFGPRYFGFSLPSCKAFSKALLASRSCLTTSNCSSNCLRKSSADESFTTFTRSCFSSSFLAGFFATGASFGFDSKSVMSDRAFSSWAACSFLSVSSFFIFSRSSSTSACNSFIFLLLLPVFVLSGDLGGLSMYTGFSLTTSRICSGCLLANRLACSSQLLDNSRLLCFCTSSSFCNASISASFCFRTASSSAFARRVSCCAFSAAASAFAACVRNIFISAAILAFSRSPWAVSTSCFTGGGASTFTCMSNLSRSSITSHTNFFVHSSRTKSNGS
mmetsp:Transcript_41299/g.118808  ORF Transcript_41299/g.118808 Transcript_41299/m.118808 type:complete len:280 (+) Transcript_41299:1959-2798(+)